MFHETFDLTGVMYSSGEPIKLTPEQEEWATYYANYLETDHVKNKIFNKNFFEDWLKVLNPTKHKEVASGSIYAIAYFSYFMRII